MKRRAFIAGLGSAAAWPVVARGQQQAMPLVGFLYPGATQVGAGLEAAFRNGLSEEGYIEGKNLAIEYRLAEGHYDRLPALAADLANRKAAVIAAVGGTAPILAAKAATSTIPIVFLTGTDPITDGLVASFNRPGGNLTGIYVLFNMLLAKQLQVLHELVPTATRIAILDNPNSPSSEFRLQEMHEPALALGLKLFVVSRRRRPSGHCLCATN
jgi:putative ABC transport system substrate-binding protein